MTDNLSKFLKVTVHTLIAYLFISPISSQEANASPYAPYKTIATLYEECSHWKAWHLNEGDLHRSEAQPARVSACGAYIRGMMDAYNGLRVLNLDTPYSLCIHASEINEIIPDFIEETDELEAMDNPTVNFENDSAWFVLAGILKDYEC